MNIFEGVVIAGKHVHTASVAIGQGLCRSGVGKFSLKVRMVNLIVFADHVVSVATAEPCRCSVKTARDNT